MSDLNPYEEGLALELKAAQDRIAALTEQLDAARKDAEEAEAYAAELETKLAKVEVLMSAGFAEYERRLSKVKEAFRRNMMQAHPAYTHEQFGKDYEELVGGKDE